MNFFIKAHQFLEMHLRCNVCKKNKYGCKIVYTYHIPKVWPKFKLLTQTCICKDCVKDRPDEIIAQIIEDMEKELGKKIDILKRDELKERLRNILL